MKKLVFIENDQALTTSLKVAEVFEKRHDHVVRDIRDIIKQAGGLPKIGESSMFTESTYINQQNKQQPMYLINRDGFTLLAMGFNGKKALQFKLAYIDAFNRMEAKLQELLAEGKTARWLETRKHGKQTRNDETAVIKIFIEYARQQGCTWEDSYFYSLITTWCNEGAGLPRRGGRDNATVQQLNIIDLMEGNLTQNALQQGMAQGLPYTQIIAQVNTKIKSFLSLTAPPVGLIK